MEQTITDLQQKAERLRSALDCLMGWLEQNDHLAPDMPGDCTCKFCTEARACLRDGDLDCDEEPVKAPTLFIKRLRDIGLTPEQITKVQEATRDICKHCWDAGRGCQCWNDY